MVGLPAIQEAGDLTRIGPFGYWAVHLYPPEPQTGMSYLMSPPPTFLLDRIVQVA